jgi:hypothetical protein
MFSIYVDGELLYRPDGDIDCAATDPVLKLEMGKSGSLTFGLPVTNALYGRLQKLVSIVQVFYDEQEVFEGRVLSLTRDFNNTLQVECEGELSYLVDSVQRNDAFTGKTTELLAEIIARHNEMVEPFKQFKMGKVTVEERDITIAGQSDKTTDDEGNFDYRQIEINSTTSEWRDTLDYIETCLINYCGGYLRARRDVAGNLYLDWIANYYDQTTQTIEFGVNMLDLEEEDDVNDIFTILIPLGTNNLTIEEVNDGSPMLVDEERVAKYGRIIKTKTFDSVSKPETLKENGERYLRENGFPKVTLTINAVDLHQYDKNVEMIRLGDRVHVLSAPHSIGDYLICTEIEYDLADPVNTEYTFGQPTQSLTQRWRKDAQKSGGGGGGGAAEAASEEAQRKIYDAWINVDPEAGHVTLGALADKADRTEKTLTGMKEYLNMKVGIDVDAKDPEAGVDINIYTMRSVLDEHDKTLLEQGTYIKQINDDTKSAIEQTTAYVDQVNAAVANHYTEFIQKSSDIESSLTLKASSDEVHAVVTKTEELGKEVANKADTQWVTTQTKLLDEEVAKKATKEEVVDLDAKVASLEISVSDNESKITAQADTITLKANKTYVDSQITEVKKIIADEIEATKANVDWLNSLSISVAFLTVRGGVDVTNSVNASSVHASETVSGNMVTANAIGANLSIKVGGKDVATQDWVNEQIAAITIPDISGDISVDSITAASGSFSSLTLGKNTLTRKSHTAITGIKGIAIKTTTATLRYTNANGDVASQKIVTGVTIDQTGLTKSTIYYYS